MSEANSRTRKEIAEERRAALPAFGSNSGITVRDYFAAAALTGYVLGGQTGRELEELADFAYRTADAMLKRRPV